MFSIEHNEPLFVEETVGDFFASLNEFAQNSDLELSAKEEIRKFFSCSDRRESHLLRALADPRNYSKIATDILDTAWQLAEIGSDASKEMLIDWITVAPDLCLERLTR